jgi:hypothetical protein
MPGRDFMLTLGDVHGLYEHIRGMMVTYGHNSRNTLVSSEVANILTTLKSKIDGLSPNKTFNLKEISAIYGGVINTLRAKMEKFYITGDNESGQAFGQMIRMLESDEVSKLDEFTLTSDYNSRQNQFLANINHLREARNVSGIGKSQILEEYAKKH